ncbi:lmo0937 family membrane protein [Methylotenera sp. L2L1]|uniref:lmo0937 family membrane protein n=1 Tax=Methylotenera sp. L2L1 TaxID=1502770 RepID=UPI00056CFACA|nr:lmo0937 family membrane protein [Methylotenera sp. L2L1]
MIFFVNSESGINNAIDVASKVNNVVLVEHSPSLKTNQLIRFLLGLIVTGGVIMLETIAIILIILWLLGLVSAYTMGGFIHLLLVIAVVVILVRLIQGKRL